MSAGLFFHVCFSFLSSSPVGFLHAPQYVLLSGHFRGFWTGRPAAPCRDSSSKCDSTQHLASFMPEWVVSASACIALMAATSHHSVDHVRDGGDADDLLGRVQSVAALLHSSLVLILMHDTFSILQQVPRIKTSSLCLRLHRLAGSCAWH